MSSAILTRSLSPLDQFVYLFALTVLIQALHMVEHVAQVIQKFVLHIAPAHGLIGALDLEQIHFGFNVLYLATLVVVMVGWFHFGSQLCNRQKALAAILIGTVTLQSYHMLEHSVKLAQFIATGMQGTPGLTGMHLDGVIFHALMTTAVFVPVVVVFFCAGLHNKLIPGKSDPIASHLDAG